MWSGEILQPILSKLFITFSSSTPPSSLWGIPTMSRYSHLEYCPFVQHCCSKVTDLQDKRVLTFFVIDSLELSLVIVSDALGTSSRTLLLASLLASSSLLCRNKTIGIRSCLRRLSSELWVYDAMIQLLELSKKRLYGEVVNIN